MNPLTIILLGPLIAKIKTASKNKLPLAFICLATAFAILFLGCGQSEVPSFFLMGSFFAIALGEIFIAPTIYARCSQLAPLQLRGVMMSLVTMGFAYGSLASGALSQKIAPQTLGEYGHFFLYATAALALAAAVLTLRRKWVNASAN
jgi:dipeptide/tripeptide permease